MPNNASISIVSLPSEVQSGMPFPTSTSTPVTFRITNTGDTTWDTSGLNFYALGSQNPASNTTWGVNAILLPSGTYAPMSVITLQVPTYPNAGYLTAPQTNTKQSFSWQMVQENVAFFGDTFSGLLQVYQLSTVLFPVASSDANDILSANIFNTGGYLIDNVERHWRWMNNTGRPLGVVKVAIWTGADRGVLADMNNSLTRISDGSYLGFQAWDHYADPVFPAQSIFDFKPYVRLANGDGVEFITISNDIAQQTTPHQGQSVWLWALYLAS
jgi:hypothetical protein